MNRSAANYEAGAKNPMASVYSSIILVGFVLLLAPFAAYLPLATAAALLFLIAYGLINVHYMKSVLKTSRSESAVMLLTFLAALFIGLDTSIYVGAILSLLLFLNRAARPGIRDVKPDFLGSSFHFDADTGFEQCHIALPNGEPRKE